MVTRDALDFARFEGDGWLEACQGWFAGRDEIFKFDSCLRNGYKR